MLQNLRDNSRGVISFILIGLLVIIFALTGVEALFNWDSSANQAAKVNGETITEMEVSRAISMQKQQLLNTYGDQVPAQFLSDDYLRKPAIDNLVQRLILSQAAREAGMAVGSDYLAEQIASAPQFKNEAGVFDNSVYQRLLRNLGYTHSTYAKILSDELLINQLQAGVAASAFSTQPQLDEVVALSFQTRDADYMILPAASVREAVEVKDAEVDAYYSANQAMFTSEEQVAVDYIALSVQDLMTKVSVSDAQLREQYELNLATFVSAPERQAAHILIEENDDKKIQTVSDKLAAGVDFAEVAAEYSDDLGSKDQGGDLGFTVGDTFPEAFESALAQLSVGDVSAPVKTDAGTHFIKLISVKNATPPSFEEQKAAIEDQLKRAEAEFNFVELLEKLGDVSYNAESLAAVAEELNLTVQNSGLFERNKGSGLLASPKVAEAAFSDDVLVDGNTSEVIEIDSSNVLVLKVTEHKPSQVKPLAEVKEQIVNTLKDQQVREVFAARAQDLVAQLNQGKALADLGEAAGLELKTLKGVARNEPEVDVDILRQVFTMAKPMGDKPSAATVFTSAGDLAVVVVNSVTPGSYETVNQEQKDVISAQLASIFGRNDFAGVQALLKDAAEIIQ